VVEQFSNNPDVAFGDINLSEEQIRGNHNPGAGGWPTIKYFNKQTGYEGVSYAKKTSKSMCDELGDDEYMRAFIEEAGSTSLCSAVTNAGCSEKEIQYIEKMKSSTQEAIDSESKRLSGMLSKGGLKSDARSWISARIAILKQLDKTKEEL